MSRPLTTSLFLLLFLAACTPAGGPLPLGPGGDGALAELPPSGAAGEAEVDDGGTFEQGDEVTEIAEAEASPTWTAPTAGSVECPALTISVSVFLDDTKAIDTNELKLELKVLNPGTGAEESLDDHDLRVAVHFPESNTIFGEEGELDWGDVDWGGIKALADQEKQKSKPDSGWRPFSGKYLPEKEPEEPRLRPMTPILLYLSRLEFIGGVQIDLGSEDPCLEIAKIISQKKYRFKAIYASRETLYAGQSEFSPNSDTLFFELPNLPLKSTKE